MHARPYRIGVVAPASRIDPALAERVTAVAAAAFGEAVELVFDPQCFLTSGHFAGDDGARAAAFVRVANDPGFDALWIGRGGYGAGRIVTDVLTALAPAARAKTYMGYSDAGALLGALHASGFSEVAHGPMPADILRESGETAVRRALSWLLSRDRAALEPTLLDETRPCAAFNLTILCTLLGTPWLPDLTGHVLMLEEVSEHHYRIDRCFAHLAASGVLGRVAGLRLGRCSLIPDNDPAFGQNEEEIARRWCERAGVAYLGGADIGHDAANKVVPFGKAQR